METMTNIITDEEVKSLTQVILTRYGLDFTCYEPKSLRRRIIRLMNLFEFTSVFELWTRVLKDPDFIHSFMNEISVGMTSMFRDPVLWRALKQRLPGEFACKSNIEILHTGCSTGEEVFSMGIVMKEAGLKNGVRALATDINRDALETARKGIYHKIKMIENGNNYNEYNSGSNFEKYYSSEGKFSIMDPTLINHANFSYHNLITDPFPGKYDIIFCRNVMIYFDGDAKARLIDKFYEALNPGGYFIIGFYDTMLSLIDHQRLPLIDADAKIFQKI